MTKVLVIDDEEVLSRTICSYLRKRGIEADFALSAREAVMKFSAMRPDLTFLDFKLGNDDGLEVLECLRARKGDAHIVMMTGHGDVSVAVQAMKMGARDFMTKPVPLGTIASIVMGAAKLEPKSSTVAGQVNTANATDLILGRSAAISEARKSIDRILTALKPVMDTPPPVMITGESGTGKELAAKALHEGGPRAKGPFIAINCASLPAALVESELFGHERGAFTDAKASKTGLFEAANGGVLFLDEIGDMPMDAQAKLLRVLETRRARRIGGVKEHEVNVWVISATHRNLEDQTANGEFRRDLLFRLQVLWVNLPPLRARDSDVLFLAEYFLALAASKYQTATPELSAEARSKLVAHNWPGNVRELRNVMERAALTTGGGLVTADGLSLPSALKGPQPPHDEGATLTEIEVGALQTALARSQGNVSRAAGFLGISRDTLRYRIQKFGLQRGASH
jgi:two-component system, NtrC family, response regulator AtoC